MTDEEKASIKYRLSDIGEQVGVLALEYISELEKENAELKNRIAFLETQAKIDFKQIETMKCCGNCSKRNQCEMNVIDSLHCDKWS